LQAFLDRPFGELSPIEACVLLAGAFELNNHPQTPYGVIINESVELAKGFGGTDGHKYVNGVLDKLAARCVRPRSRPSAPRARPDRVAERSGMSGKVVEDRATAMPGEFELIRSYFSRPTPQAVLGPGDDCALLAPSPDMQLAITTDMLVEGTHFLPDTDPRQARLESAGGQPLRSRRDGRRPRWALLAGSLPEAREPGWPLLPKAVCLRQRYGVDLVGGDTTRGPLNLCLTAIGEIPAGAALRRDRAFPGDDLWVSGQPGLAATGPGSVCRAGRSSPKRWPDAASPPCSEPLPRVELGLELRSRPGARGHRRLGRLLADLGHIVESSAVAAEVFVGTAAIAARGRDPVLARQCQLAGGDDYELVFSAPPESDRAIADLAAASNCRSGAAVG
jgi:thiamine-monophosphate kinase